MRNRDSQVYIRKIVEKYRRCRNRFVLWNTKSDWMRRVVCGWMEINVFNIWQNLPNSVYNLYKSNIIHFQLTFLTQSKMWRDWSCCVCPVVLSSFKGTIPKLIDPKIWVYNWCWLLWHITCIVHLVRHTLVSGTFSKTYTC